MNYKMMGRLIAQILLAEAAFMVPALIISLAGQDSQAILGFALSILVILAVAGVLMFFARKAKKGFYAREGMVCVGLAWIVMSLLGCLPFHVKFRHILMDYLRSYLVLRQQVHLFYRM